VSAGLLVRDVIMDQAFDVFHDLGIAAVGVTGHGSNIWTAGLVDGCGLGEKDEGDGEESFDPFNLYIVSCGIDKKVLYLPADLVCESVKAGQLICCIVCPLKAYIL
jgi:hypothetical protein